MTKATWQPPVRHHDESPVFPEANGLESRRLSDPASDIEVFLASASGMSPEADKTLTVAPVDPVQGGTFHGCKMTPWAITADDLGLEQPDQRGSAPTHCGADYRHARPKA